MISLTNLFQQCIKNLSEWEIEFQLSYLERNVQINEGIDVIRKGPLSFVMNFWNLEHDFESCVCFIVLFYIRLENLVYLNNLFINFEI